MSSAQKIGLAGIVLFAGLLVAVWPEIPAWRAAGTRSIAAQSVAYGYDRIDCPSPGSVIAIFGDSHVEGREMGEDAASRQHPYGKVLEQALSGRVVVKRNGIGGHTAQMGEKIWLQRNHQADLVIIAYGTNDAAPRGWLSDKEPVPIATFKASVARHVAHWRGQEREVILLAPPPGGSAAINRRLQPYREATRAIGMQLQVAVLDPGDAFAACAPSEPLLTQDALHMNAAGHQCLGTWIASRVCPRKPA